MELLRTEANNLNLGNKTLLELGRELGLQEQQTRFAEVYVSPESLGSNGRYAAAEAYGYDMSTKEGKQNASNTANRNLKHPQVNLLIAILLDTVGFNNEYVDKQLMALIEQNADPKTKVMAIAEYNKVQNRIKTTVEHISKPAFDFSVFTPEELQQFINLTERAAIRYEETKNIPLLNG